MVAKECFDRALGATNTTDRRKWEQRGREYSELAIAMDAETGKGANPPSSLTAEEPPRRSNPTHSKRQ
jgi:hypothetical protein